MRSHSRWQWQRTFNVTIVCTLTLHFLFVPNASSFVDLVTFYPTLADDIVYPEKWTAESEHDPSMVLFRVVSMKVPGLNGPETWAQLHILVDSKSMTHFISKRSSFASVGFSGDDVKSSFYSRENRWIFGVLVCLLQFIFHWMTLSSCSVTTSK